MFCTTAKDKNRERGEPNPMLMFSSEALLEKINEPVTIQLAIKQPNKGISANFPASVMSRHLLYADVGGTVLKGAECTRGGAPDEPRLIVARYDHCVQIFNVPDRGELIYRSVSHINVVMEKHRLRDSSPKGSGLPPESEDA